MKPVRTWILIADAGRARVLENLGPGRGLTPVDAMASNADLPPTHEIVSDRQTRSYESNSETRHAVEPKTDPREQLKRAHLEAIAARLASSLAAGAFDRLVVVAPPTALGILRDVFTDSVRKVVTGELAKDLTKTPVHDLKAHLEDIVRV